MRLRAADQRNEDSGRRMVAVEVPLPRSSGY
jgi:hypothetical protein